MRSYRTISVFVDTTSVGASGPVWKGPDEKLPLAFILDTSSYHLLRILEPSLMLSVCLKVTSSTISLYKWHWYFSEHQWLPPHRSSNVTSNISRPNPSYVICVRGESEIGNFTGYRYIRGTSDDDGRKAGQIYQRTRKSSCL